jgi:ABC-type Fe3+ transport system permease subunit
MNASWNYKRQVNADYCICMRRMGLTKRFRRSVTETNWDQDLWGLEKWIDLFSWIVIASSLFFLIPVTLSVFGK